MACSITKWPFSVNAIHPLERSSLVLFSTDWNLFFPFTPLNAPAHCLFVNLHACEQALLLTATL